MAKQRLYVRNDITKVTSPLGSSAARLVGSSPTTRTITLEQDFLLEILALKFFRNKIIKSKIIHNAQIGDITLVAGPSSLYLLYNQCIKLIF